jgi:hypothetical protein
MSFYVSVDLGQSQDYTAVSVLEVEAQVDTTRYLIRHLLRYPLGTSYPAIVTSVTELMRRIGECVLIVDQTGVGAPVTDMFRSTGVSPISISITSGNIASFSPAENALDPAEKLNHLTRWSVPKRDLVSSLAVALQRGQLRIAQGLPEADQLVHELMNFRVRISDAGHDSYSSWRERDHDDLVLSIAMGVFAATRLTGSQVPLQYAAGAGGVGDFDRNRPIRRHLKTVWCQPDDDQQQDGGLPGLSPWY